MHTLGGAARAVAPAHGVRVKAPTLILPARVQRPPPRVNSREIGVYVPSEALFPDLEASEASMAALLSTLSRDAALLACARLNTVVSGTGHPAFCVLLGSVPSGKRVMPLTVMTIADLENLESSIGQFSTRRLLTDYAAAYPDGLAWRVTRATQTS